jgi:hypothetical protein
MATLVETVYELKRRQVMIRVKISVQGNDHIISCFADESKLLAHAMQNGRADWNTADCAAIASIFIGQDVSLPEDPLIELSISKNAKAAL